jgi:hypothetical protein
MLSGRDLRKLRDKSYLLRFFNSPIVGGKDSIALLKTSKLISFFNLPILSGNVVNRLSLRKSLSKFSSSQIFWGSSVKFAPGKLNPVTLLFRYLKPALQKLQMFVGNLKSQIFSNSMRISFSFLRRLIPLYCDLNPKSIQRDIFNQVICEYYLESKRFDFIKAFTGEKK